MTYGLGAGLSMGSMTGALGGALIGSKIGAHKGSLVGLGVGAGLGALGGTFGGYKLAKRANKKEDIRTQEKINKYKAANKDEKFKMNKKENFRIGRDIAAGRFI